MFRLFVALLSFVVRAISAICRSRGDLVFENIALRQQAAALKKERPRPELDDTDRAFWVAVRGAWPKWIWDESSVYGRFDAAALSAQLPVRPEYLSVERAGACGHIGTASTTG